MLVFDLASLDVIIIDKFVSASQAQSIRINSGLYLLLLSH